MTITQEPDTAAEYVRSAAALREQLRAHAQEADANRHLAPSDIDAITDAGLTALWAPAEFGGPETSVRTAVDVISTLGQGDAAAGWTAGVNNAANFSFALFSDEAKREIWSTPGKMVRGAGVLAPAGHSQVVEGGIRVSGRWPYMSGVTVADWVFMTAPLNGGMGPDMELGFVLVPASDISIDDNWYVTGMRATASAAAVLDDVFVPEHRILRWRDYRSDNYSGLYRSGIFPILSICITAPLVGAAETALEFVKEKALSRPIVTTTYRTQVESAALQTELGRAAELVQSARRALEGAADEMDEVLASGESLSELYKSRNRADCAYVVNTVWEAVDLLASIHGTSTFAQGNPLEIIWRNAAVAARHAGLNQRVSNEILGRALLGLDPNAVGPNL